MPRLALHLVSAPVANSVQVMEFPGNGNGEKIAGYTRPKEARAI